MIDLEEKRDAGRQGGREGGGVEGEGKAMGWGSPDTVSQGGEEGRSGGDGECTDSGPQNAKDGSTELSLPAAVFQQREEEVEERSELVTGHKILTVEGVARACCLQHVHCQEN